MPRHVSADTQATGEFSTTVSEHRPRKQLSTRCGWLCRLGRWLCGLALLGGFWELPAVRADDPQDAQPLKVIDLETTPSTVALANPTEMSAEETKRVGELIDQLSSRRFIVRERALNGLAELGPKIVPQLAAALEEVDDPEAYSRIKGIATRLTEAFSQMQIEQFLSGKDVGFSGWRQFREAMGSSLVARELYVEVRQSYPDLLDALDERPPQIINAWVNVGSRIEQKRFIERIPPDRADVIALFLPVLYEQVPILPGSERQMIMVLNMEAVSGLRRDQQLRPGFAKLLGSWVQRATLRFRSEILFHAMNWELDEALPKAIETIGETDDYQSLVIAMEVIAKFGDPSHTQLVAPLLDNHEGSRDATFSGSKIIQAQICDYAIATIAILNGQPLEEYGFTPRRPGRNFAPGFRDHNIGFPSDAKKERRQNIQKAKQLIETSSSETSPPEANSSQEGP